MDHINHPGRLGRPIYHPGRLGRPIYHPGYVGGVYTPVYMPPSSLFVGVPVLLPYIPTLCTTWYEHMLHRFGLTDVQF